MNIYPRHWLGSRAGIVGHAAGRFFPPFRSFWRDEVTTPRTAQTTVQPKVVSKRNHAPGRPFFMARLGVHKGKGKPMNVETENAHARSAAPMESRPAGSSHALMRVIPNDNDNIDDIDTVDVDDLGSPEAPPPKAAEETPHAQADTDELRATPEQTPIHPLAEIFPLLEGPEFAALVSDIADRGQLEAIVLCEGKILDGRNRYRACLAAGVAPRFEHYEGDDPLGLVVSRNIRRRHLDESQRALVAAKLETMKHGGNRQAGQDANLRVDRSAAAKMLNVSKRSVASAAKVLAEGEGELVRAVEQAKITISAAAKATELGAKLQHQVAEKALAGDAKAARTIIGQALHERPSAEPMTLRAAKTMIAELREALEEAEADFVALRDPLPDDVAAKATELAVLAASDDVAARDELAALALRHHWRLRDLVVESWNALVSRPASEEAVDRCPDMMDVDESTSDEGSAS
jgi:hypothetical protein